MGKMILLFTPLLLFSQSTNALIDGADKGFAASSEMLRNLHPYDEWILWFMRFEESLEKKQHRPEDFQLSKDLHYIIPRSYSPHNRIELSPSEDESE